MTSPGTTIDTPEIKLNEGSGYSVFWENTKLKKLNIFIGYDEVERVAWHTLTHSIIERSTIPIAITPVSIQHFGAFFKRTRDPKQSNSFSFSRFCVPYLMDYIGYALFMDCDMLLRVDIAELLKVIEAQPDKAVYVVKHDYTPSNTVKYLNTTQYTYPRKNWSSFVLWNCGHEKNKVLDVEFFNKATGLDLHRFTWLEDEEIGELDVTWNWLVGDYINAPNNVKNIHWTLGGPYFNEFVDADFADEWFSANKSMNYCKQLIDSK